jgi:hypothetical protein
VVDRNFGSHFACSNLERKSCIPFQAAYFPDFYSICRLFIPGTLWQDASPIILELSQSIPSNPFLPVAMRLSFRAELQWRIALFYCTGCFAGGLSGSFSYAITRLDGTLGLAGWAWVFIVEYFPLAIRLLRGKIDFDLIIDHTKNFALFLWINTSVSMEKVDGILTILGGSLGFVMFPASPDDSHFLTVDEKQYVLEWTLSYIFKLFLSRMMLMMAIRLDMKLAGLSLRGYIGISAQSPVVIC